MRNHIQRSPQRYIWQAGRSSPVSGGQDFIEAGTESGQPPAEKEVLSRSYSTQYGWDGPKQNAEVGFQAPVPDVRRIQVCAGRKAHITSSGNLPQPGEARGRGEIEVFQMPVQGYLCCNDGSWADQ